MQSFVLFACKQILIEFMVTVKKYCKSSIEPPSPQGGEEGLIYFKSIWGGRSLLEMGGFLN